ncbi:probable zinc transporter 8 [Pistacia vera]|uniref:probable zinc transporter 8 n=1 Tax=Pistacia vera TaxID=55513 RepID=UPI001263954A|nr:probable zinc transporter 8 [Pistacia vera]
MATRPTTTPSLLNNFSISFFLILSIFTSQALSQSNDECTTASSSCNDKAAALPLKIIAIVTILITSLIGVSAPLFTRSVKALHPDRNLFVVVKSFAAGIILATGFMHVLPDSFDMLSSSCLEDNPWHKFPFTGFVAMLSAIVTLMVDSLATSIYSEKCNAGGGVVIPEGERDEELAAAPPSFGHMHGHSHHLDQTKTAGSVGSQLMRYRVIAMVLELGIVVHSIVIGLSVGASNNTCSIKGLIAALCFHQMFEGMGLGGCILQAEYKLFKKMVMVFFFAVTTPFGIALGIALSNTYKENSPTALISVGLLNASSAGLLIYMALVDLLAADFMGQKLQGSIRLQLKSYVAVLLGAGGMSLMAKWA